MTATKAQEPATTTATALPQGAPAHFGPHVFEKSFTVPAPREAVWAWLNDPATFVDGQVWPFRVEFVGGGMEPGVLNIHHGPAMNFVGVVGEMHRPVFRDLHYLYGSYAVTLRWFRPTRLRFWLAENGDGETVVRLRLDSLVRRRMHGAWTFLLKAYWSLFPFWTRRGVARRERR